MESGNNSVIVCETPSSSNCVQSTWCNTVTNYRKRLRSNDASRKLLERPYESPLNHFKRNLNTVAEATDAISYATAAATPEAKKRKIHSIKDNSKQLDLNGSVTIVDDTTGLSFRTDISDDEESDVVEVAEKNQSENKANSSRRKIPKTNTKKSKSPKKRSTILKQKKQKDPRTNAIKSKNRRNKNSTVDRSTVNDENHDRQIMETQTNESEVATAEDVEEIEVVWSSKPNVEPASQGASTVRTRTTPQRPFVIDVVPAMTNLFVNEYYKNLSIMMNGRSRVGQYAAVNGQTRMVTQHPAVIGQTKVTTQQPSGRLREIVIDGSNVAMGHARNQTFSEKGLKIVVDYFKNRGHAVKVFLPQSARMRSRELIEKWHVEGIVVFTPSRKINGRIIAPYDDRYILEYATQCNGIVVSSDQYRDLWQEKPQWRNTIENRLLTPTFAGDYLMFPEDPLGRSGPKLEEFLRH